VGADWGGARGERPPAKAGGFGLRLKAGFGRPQGPTIPTWLHDVEVIIGYWVATGGNVTDEVAEEVH